MGIDKTLLSGSNTMLILSLLEKSDMYGYQIIEELEAASGNVFSFKAGTLYPLLHNMEQRGLIESYEKDSTGGLSDKVRVRIYYRITKDGRNQLGSKKDEWKLYVKSVNKVLGGAENARA